MPSDKNAEIFEFRLRLESLLLKKGKSLSPTALARDFNLRWRGAPVTVNATRKWLLGQAIPTMDKLTVLSNMLNSSVDWLRWGLATEERTDGEEPCEFDNSRTAQVSHDAKSFSQDFALLNPKNKRVVGAVLEVLLKEQLSAARH